MVHARWSALASLVVLVLAPVAPDDTIERREIGLTLAVVLDDKDPDGRSRVLVRFQNQRSHQAWGRVVAAFPAGTRSGSFTLPRVGDVVVVGFEHGDPNEPLVLGAVWNGASAGK